MKQRIHLFALLFCLLLAACLLLVGCGGEVVGDDWRVSGIVDADGTITHDGESVDVLVAVSPESAAFYRDEAEQILFDSVSFPMAIPDAESAFYAIRFDDLDGDAKAMSLWTSATRTAPRRTSCGSGTRMCAMSSAKSCPM